MFKSIRQHDGPCAEIAGKSGDFRGNCLSQKILLSKVYESLDNR